MRPLTKETVEMTRQGLLSSDWCGFSKRDTVNQLCDLALKAIESETRQPQARLPALPEEIQEWCWHMDTHVTEHDLRHAGLALRAAWPHVSQWLKSVVRPSDKAGTPFKDNALVAQSLEQRESSPQAEGSRSSERTEQQGGDKNSEAIAWHERERVAFEDWWNSRGEHKYTEPRHMAAGAAWFARASMPSATPRAVNTMPLIKRIKDQRDECADALRPFVQAGGPHDWKLALEQANKVLAGVPTYEQQLRNVAEGIGMTYEELIEAVNAHRAEGRTEGT